MKHLDPGQSGGEPGHGPAVLCHLRGQQGREPHLQRCRANDFPRQDFSEWGTKLEVDIFI